MTLESQQNAAYVVSLKAALLTYKGNTFRTGQMNNETILTTKNVTTSQFGKRISYPVDGQVLAQPLFMPRLTINGGVHNVAFVATEHDSVYAFDADKTRTTPPLWKTSFLKLPTVTTVSPKDVSCDAIKPEYGITGTPVIDPDTGTLYVVVFTKENSKFIYRLHALNIKTGKDKPGSPTLIQATVPGTGLDSSNGVVRFNPQHQNQRSGLLLLHGIVYIAWGGFCDNDPFHGWLLGYNASSLQLESLYNDSANGSRAGIWQGGGGLAADDEGYIYFMTGDGTFDLDTGGVDAGDSILKLSTQHGLNVVDYFTPFNQSCLEVDDIDLGSGGVMLFPSIDELFGVGKEGRIYIVNRHHMGKYTSLMDPCNNQQLINVDKVVQELPPQSIVGGMMGAPAYWHSSVGDFVYAVGLQDHLKAFKLTNGLLSASPASQTPESFLYSGGNPVVSSNGTIAGTGVLWTIDPSRMLRAYDSTNLTRELYNSEQNASRDRLGSYAKFSVPTVADGSVFVGTQNSLVIYSLLH